VLDPVVSSSAQAAPMPRPAGQSLVIGAGPVGLRAAQELVRQGQTVTVLGDESVSPYNRVRLTPLLSGDVRFGEIVTPTPEDSDMLTVCLGQRAVRIDRDKRHVITADGSLWPYQSLVLALGSHAFVPNIPGAKLPGVYRFRTADDASALMARSFSARHVAVIGGGLLGLEAARGMRRKGCTVTVIEHEPQLMPRQLDKAGGETLAAAIAALGVEVRTGTAVKRISGTHRVEGLVLAGDATLACDTVIICTGVRANTALAKSAGLNAARGILVDDRMQTSDPDIYAVGECAEHDGKVVGLVGPGYAQAEAAARAIAGHDANYIPVQDATKLKVIGADVFSAGPIPQLDAGVAIKSYVWRDGDSYRRIFLDRGRLKGAVGVGPWDQASRMQDAVRANHGVLPWMLFRFVRTGNLWIDEEVSVAEMADSATLCNCTGVSVGQARAAHAQGCRSARMIGLNTGAGTVCGTCLPLLSEVVNANAAPEPVRFHKPILALSLVAGLAALAPLIFGYVPLPTSYTPDDLRTWLWQDPLVKQWTGFVLVGLTLAAMVIGLRKRWRITDRLGSYDGWRLVHLAIGGACFAGLLAHTGLNLGAGLNLALGVSFVGAALSGAVTGLATGGDHTLRAHRIGTARKPARRLPTWVHVLFLWPLPVLLLLHVLIAYAY